jgi:tetratricopeptide (TPR) repeat protein
VDARVDQFSFCAALYEALYGELPFDGEGFAAYTGAVLAGKLRPARAGTGVPARLRADLVRGLRTRPEDRYPSMRELLEALRARARRRTGAAIAAGALALLCAGALAQVLLTRPHVEPICSGAQHKLDGIWDLAARQALRSAFAATSRSYAADTGERVVRVLDGYSTAWVGARTDACLATRVRGEQSETLLDLRMACLDRRLVEMKALVYVLTRSADDDLVNRAVEATSKLTRLDGCSDAQALESLVPPPEDARLRARVEAVYGHLEEAKAEYRVARYKNALELVNTAAADPVAYAPVHARALFERARVEDEMGDYKATERSLLEALPVAAAGRDDRLTSEIWSLLVYVVAFPLARAHDAQAMLVAGEAALLRAGSPHDAESTWLYSKAIVSVGLRRFEDAASLTERALAIDEESDALPVVKASWIASDLDQLANISKTLGKVDASVEYSTRSIAMRERALGPDHPRLADALNNLSVTLIGVGRYAEAAPLLARALAIDEKAIGGQTLRAARILGNLAEVARAQGRYDDAERAFRRALTIREKVLGLDHGNLRWTLANLAGVLRQQRRFDDAGAAAARALAVGEKGADAEHVDAPVPGLVALGEIAYDRGHYADARVYAERALVLADAVQANDATAPLDPLRDLARASLAVGRPRDALAAAERALTIAEANPMAPAEVAGVRFVLAQALRAAGGDRARAVTLAEQARDAFSAAGAGKARELEETLAFLRMAR